MHVTRVTLSIVLICSMQRSIRLANSYAWHPVQFVTALVVGNIIAFVEFDILDPISNKHTHQNWNMLSKHVKPKKSSECMW